MLMSRLWKIMLVLICVSFSVFAQDAPLFEATFDDGTIPDSLNIQFGQYEVTDNSLSYTVNNGGFLVIPEGFMWTDYAIETRLKITSGSVWLQARTGSDLCSGYYLTINPDANVYDLSVADRECNFTVLDVIDDASVSDEWIVARIDVQGDQIHAYIDDERVLSVTDSNYSMGYPIINVFPTESDEAQVQFDTIRVTDLSISEPVAEITTEPDIIETPQIEETPIPETTAEPVIIELPSVNEIPLNDDPQQMIASLQELGLIPAGEGELFIDNNVTVSRIGAWFEPLFGNTIAQHVVMSGTINFLPYNESESCLLSARIIRDEAGVAQRYLDVGLNSRNQVFIGESADNGDYSQATQDDVLTDLMGHFLFIAYGNRLSVYVDGQAIFQNIEVTQREGSLGISAIESTSYSVCRVTDVWAYTFAS